MTFVTSSTPRLLSFKRPPLRILRFSLSGLILLLAAAFALAPSVFAPFNPVEGIPGAQLQAPNSTYLLGTDELGRDLLSRLIHGARYSLSSAFLAVVTGLIGGSALGILAGALGGRIDSFVMRFVDVLLAVPSLLLALALIILLGFGHLQVALAVGLTSIASFARLARAETLVVRRSDYVEAAFGSGGKFWPVLWRHILPNATGAVLAYAALQFGWAILQISTLGFLGYGAPPPTPEWGLLIAEGRAYMATSWWLTLFPGLAVMLVVLAANQLARAVQGGRR